MTDLKHCPFCGADAYSCETEEYDSMSCMTRAWVVGCETCEANITIANNYIDRWLSDTDMKRIAEERWNRRHP